MMRDALPTETSYETTHLAFKKQEVTKLDGYATWNGDLTSS